MNWVRWAREVGGGFLELSFVFFLLLLLFLLCSGPLHGLDYRQVEVLIERNYLND